MIGSGEKFSGVFIVEWPGGPDFENKIIAKVKND